MKQLVLSKIAGGMLSCRLCAAFLSKSKELQAGGNASIINHTVINNTTCYLPAFILSK